MIYEIVLPTLLVIANFATVLLLVRLGKDYLYSYSALIGAFIVLLIPFNIDILGFPFAVVEVLFAAFFLTTDILSELYGKKEARKTLFFAIIGTLIAFAFVRIGLLLTPSEFDLGKEYLGIISSMFTPFAFFAVTTVFIIEQSIDIYNFDLIRRKTKNKYLWLRNCVSTVATQSLDVLVVYPIFFYPILGSAIWKLMLAAIIFKIIMAFLDTPFIYLSRYIHEKKPIKLLDQFSTEEQS